MSDNSHKISVTLKGGTGYDSPWIVVYGNTPAEIQDQLDGIGDLIAATVETANLLKAANNAAPLLENGAAATPAAAPAAAPAQRQTGGWSGGGAPAASHPNAQVHPGGEVCDFNGCGKPLEFKKTSSGKGTWRCSDWRWGNGNPNGHKQLWAD